MEKFDITDQDEIIILQNGVDTEFWRLLTHNFTAWRDMELKKLLSPNFDHKDYLSGKVKTLEDVMNFPTSRVNRLTKKKV